MTHATRLLRQVHPKFAPDGELTSQAFFPFPKDEGKLSVYDGDQIEPRESHQHYTGTLCNESVGVWGVTISEVTAVGLTAVSDPLENFSAHTLIDFAQRDEKACRKLAKKLKAAALERGCLFTP
jgi:hypothetical protein